MSTHREDERRPRAEPLQGQSAPPSPPPLSPSARPWTYAQVVASPPRSPRQRSPVTVALPAPVSGPTPDQESAQPQTSPTLAVGQAPLAQPSAVDCTPPVRRAAAVTPLSGNMHRPRRGLPVTPPRVTTAITPATVDSTRTGTAPAPLLPADSVRRRKRARLATPSPPPTAPVTPTSRAPLPSTLAPRSVRTIDHRRPSRLLAYPQHRPTPILTIEPRPPSPPRSLQGFFSRSTTARPMQENAMAGPSNAPEWGRTLSNPFVVPHQPNHAPSSPTNALRASRGVRFADEELAEDADHPRPAAMELDLPLFYQRPGGGEFGVPLRELDLNRARFPNALRRDPSMVPQPPPDAYTMFAGNTPGPSTPIPIRFPAPRAPAVTSPVHDVSFPSDPVSAVFGDTISPSNAHPHTPAPIAALGGGPPSPFRFTMTPPAAPRDNTVPPASQPFADTMALLYNASPAVDPAFTFTPTPAGGFPDVAWQDPEALFYGLSRSRMVAMLDSATGTRLALQVYNLGFPQAAELRSITNAIIGALQVITNELNILVVPPEHDYHGDDRRGPPLTWLILGFSEESRQRLLARRVWSCFTITFIVYAAEIRIPRLLGTVGGFVHDHSNSIFTAVRAVLSGPRVLPHILQLVTTNPTFVGTRPEIAARAVLNTLQVRVSLLQNGNLIAAIFIDSPTQSVGRWRDWRNVITGLPFPSPLNSTGRFRRPALCAGCHGADHPTHLCPFPDVPGWNAPPPGAHWAHPGQQHPAPAGAGAPPPPPPPPPGGASYAAPSSTSRGGRGRGSRSSSRVPDARGKRSWRSFGDENRPY